MLISRKKWILLLIFIGTVLSFTGNTFGSEVETDSAKIDRLLAQFYKDFKFNFDRTPDTLAELKRLEPSFSKAQKDSIYLAHASMLGFQGKHRERADLVKSYLDQATEPNIRARFLGQLVSSYVALGEYEGAISVMNESTDLIPKLSKDISVRSVLQSTIGVLKLFRAFDDALVYANKMLQMKEDPGNPGIKCMAILNVIEINYLQGNAQRARSLIPESDVACRSIDLLLYRQILRALTVIDLINTGNFKQGISVGLPLVEEFEKINNGTEYRIRLEEALGRAFAGIKDYNSASRFGLLALDHAKVAKSVAEYELAANTLAKIKEEQGDLAGALQYAKIALEYRQRRTNDDLEKNIAFQRVKFDSKAKASQLSSLEKQNDLLVVEREFAQVKNQRLLVALIVSCFTLLTLIFALLVVLKQRRNLVRAIRLDSLTQAYSRDFFILKTTEVIENRKSEVALIMLNLDRFQRVNEACGFAISDALLVEVCRAIKQCVRENDIVGRTGGDEFAICMVGATEEIANDIADQCRRAVSMISLEHGAQNLKLTASLGVAVVDTKGLTSFADTFNAARSALRSAKISGGNCVKNFGQEIYDKSTYN